MFIHKLRTVATICQKQGFLRNVLRSNKPTLPLPSTSVITRQFTTKFPEEDDDDYLPRDFIRGRQPARERQQRDFGSARQEFKSKFENNRFSSDRFRNDNFSSDRFSNNSFSNNRNSNNRSFGGLQKPNWDMASLEEIKKDFYQPQEKTLNRSDEEVDKFRAENEVSVQNGAPKPILDFDELSNVPQSLLDVIKKNNFEKASSIQAQGWPIALSGKNMVGIAQTGWVKPGINNQFYRIATFLTITNFSSGKTLGFILPAIVHILNQPRANRTQGPTALVMAPTRELAQQIQEVANQFGVSSGVRNACLFGGSSKISQAQILSRGCQLVVGTPGRLIDFVQTGELKLHQCSYLVLDEADRMLDMGFEPQIRQIIDQIRPDRQTLMFSATWPKEVRHLAEDFLSDYVQVNVGSLELSANHNIKQVIKICTEATKDENLQEIIETIRKDNKSADQKTLIFTNTKRRADDVAYQLRRKGISSDSIHGDKTQFKRENTLSDFRDGRIQLMVATEVAARGLDVNNIKYVINYDYPNNSADYIHRIGRTGRSGNTGTAYTLLTEENSEQVADLIEVMKEANQDVDPELYQLAQQRNRSGRNSSGRGSSKRGSSGSNNSYRRF